jgi:hypothetical protein
MAARTGELPQFPVGRIKLQQLSQRGSPGLVQGGTNRHLDGF